MKLSIAADAGVQKAVAGTAAASGAAAWLAQAKDLALELFGVPLPVVLACATASYGALSFVSGMSYLKTIGAGLVWTLVGTYGAQLSLSMIGSWTGVQVPTGALAGAGMLVAGAGPLVVTLENVQKLRDAAGRLIDGIGKGRP